MMVDSSLIKMVISNAKKSSSPLLRIEIPLKVVFDGQNYDFLLDVEL